METIPETTSHGNPFDGNPSPFPSFGNIGAPYMTALSLPGFTIGFPVWLFSTSLVSNVQTTPQLSPPYEKHQPQVDPQVDPLPSSPIVSSSLSSSLPGESIGVSNQKAKKKNKSKKMKNPNKQGGKQETIVINVASPSKPCKGKLPYMFCKFGYLLRYCPSIPQVLEVWSIGPHQPLLSI